MEAFWPNLLAGRSGISKVTRFDPSEYKCQVAAEVHDFDVEDYMDRKDARRHDRYTHYAMAAARMALEDSQLQIGQVDKDRFGVIIGSGIGGLQTFQHQHQRLLEMGPNKVSPFTIPALIPNIASGMVAIEMGAKGPNFATVSACSSGSHAIGEAFSEIQAGKADIFMAGGAEAPIVSLAYGSFCAMKAMSTRCNHEPEKASCPFDQRRDGFIMGEGSGILVLEALEHAEARNARIYCELVGYGASADAYHITAPDPEAAGLNLCISNALSHAGMSPHEIDYINAHGTSTVYNDSTETHSIKKVFGDHAYNVAISSTKSMTGHLLGAAGGIEAAIVTKAIQTGKIPPTINYEVPDPSCDLNYVPNHSIERPVKAALSNNLGFGGQNATLVMKAF